MKITILIAAIVFATCITNVCAHSTIITTIGNTTIRNRTDAVIYTSTEKSPVYEFLDNNIYYYIRQPLKIVMKILLTALLFVITLIVNILIALGRGLQHIHDVYENFGNLIAHHIFNNEYSYIESKFIPYNWGILSEGFIMITDW